jgi:hypothetical protein
MKHINKFVIKLQVNVSVLKIQIEIKDVQKDDVYSSTYASAMFTYFKPV